MHDSSIYYGRLLRHLMRLLEVGCGHSLYEVLPRGVQVWVPEDDLGLYPDALVVAGAPLLHEGHSDKVINPCVMFEILSEATPAFSPTDLDWAARGPQFMACDSIPYLQEYVFIHQQEARVEQFCRTQPHRWEVTSQTGLDAVVELNITGTRLPLLELYQDLDFQP